MQALLPCACIYGFFFLSMIFLAVRNAKDTKSSNIKNASDKHVPVY